MGNYVICNCESHIFRKIIASIHGKQGCWNTMPDLLNLFQLPKDKQEISIYLS